MRWLRYTNSVYYDVTLMSRPGNLNPSRSSYNRPFRMSSLTAVASEIARTLRPLCGVATLKTERAGTQVGGLGQVQL